MTNKESLPCRLHCSHVTHGAKCASQKSLWIIRQKKEMPFVEIPDGLVHFWIPLTAMHFTLGRRCLKTLGFPDDRDRLFPNSLEWEV